VKLDSETRPSRGLMSRFGSAMVPLAVATFFFAPGYEGRIRTTFSRASRSESSINDIIWDFDTWVYSEEPADIEQIRMLNRLLALDAPDGFSLDL